jgi:hypothetical protein
MFWFVLCSKLFGSEGSLRGESTEDSETCFQFQLIISIKNHQHHQRLPRPRLFFSFSRRRLHTASFSGCGFAVPWGTASKDTKSCSRRAAAPSTMKKIGAASEAEAASAVAQYFQPPMLLHAAAVLVLCTLAVFPFSERLFTYPAAACPALSRRIVASQQHAALRP